MATTERPVQTADSLDQEIPLTELLRPLIERRRAVGVSTLVGALVGIVLRFLLPPAYTAETTFTPDQGRGGITLPSGLAGLAGSLGLPMDLGTRSSVSPDFLISLLDSREILEPLLDSTFATRGRSRAAPPRKLIDLLAAKGNTLEKRLEAGLAKLRRKVSASVDRRSNLLTLRVVSGDPLVAATLANRLFDALNRYNVEQLQSQAHRQRVFVEDRLTQARAELVDAEQDQLHFLQTNRSYTESPTLRIQAARLQRIVDLKQEVMVTLAKAYEEARIEEQRAIPTLIVVDAARPPVRPSFPRAILLGPAGAAMGLLLAAVWAFWRGRVGGERGGAADAGQRR